MARDRLGHLATYLLVALGGAAGATLRWLIDVAVPANAAGIAWEIVTINVVGSLALGALVGHIEHAGEPRWYPAVGPGLLGGFTTYSAAAAAQLAIETASAPAIAVLVTTLIAAVVAAGLGWRWSERRGAAIARERAANQGAAS